MIKKVVGIVIVGLLITTILPVGSAQDQPIDEKTDITKINKLSSQIEIKIKGGFAVHAFIKNIGTTDITDADMTIVANGRLIFGGFEISEDNVCIDAGKTELHIIPVFGLGGFTMEITIDGITETASATALGRFVFGVN
jgi:hypothetical protein